MSDTTQPTDNQLLSVGQLAELLGVPARTIYTWRYRRTAPPGIRLGKHLRFRRRDVEAWIDEHRSH